MSFFRIKHQKPQSPDAPETKENEKSAAELLVAAAPDIFSQAPVEAERKQTIQLSSIVLSIACGLAAVSLIARWFSQSSWQFILQGILFLASAVFFGMTMAHFKRSNKRKVVVVTMSIALGLSMLGTGALFDQLGIPAAVICLLFSLIVSSTAVDNVQANLAIGIGILFACSSALVNSYSPFAQLPIKETGIAFPAVLGAIGAFFIIILIKELMQSTMRARLVTAFLAIVIIPLITLSLIQSQFMSQVLNREVSQGLTLAAGQATAGIDQFLSDSEKSVQEASKLEIFSRYLALPESQRAGSSEEQEMQLTLKVLDTSISNNNIYLSSYALLDAKGINVYDSLKDRIANRLPAEALQSMGVDLKSLLPSEGSYEGAADYFMIPAQSGVTYISPVQVTSSTRGFFYISSPVTNSKGSVIGVLRARYDGLLLQDLLKQYNGLLTDKSYAILVDEYNIRLADAFTPNYIYKSVMPLSADRIKILQENKRLPKLPSDMLSTNYPEFDRFLNNYEKQPVFITTHSLLYNDDKHSEIVAVAKLRTMPWRIVYLRGDFSYAEILKSQMQITTLVTGILAGLVTIVAVLTAQGLSRPILRLATTAQQITNGDLTAQAPAHNTDEFGKLGAAFNLMTNQIRELISQLEDRVKARTQEVENQNETLANRARQMETIANVARQIVSSQELETLLTSITQVISERFEFYHVGIFLLDENKQYAVLRAANSEGGQRMLKRRHMLSVGKVGVVGYTTGKGQARIVTDVGEDAVYFNNPDLPETRSEMALPLKVGDEVIGALDIQSKEPNAFHEDDVEMFNILADQVAIAIYNNNLYTETRRALDEAQNLHRQYLRGEWAKDVERRKAIGYLYNQYGVSAQQTESPLWQEIFTSGEPAYATLAAQPDAQDKSIMAVPIAIRGETIGVIQVQDQGHERSWSEDEISVINSVASQVAVALENARLFENTVRRAEREKKVLQITEKIRATNDPGEMIRVAISELQQALGASRAQIYVRQNDAETTKAESQTNPNGRSNGNGRVTGPLGKASPENS